MAVTTKLYGLALLSMLGGVTEPESHKIDFLTDDIRVMLCTSEYMPDQDAHQFKSQITNEVSGTGYLAGGAAMLFKTMVYDPLTKTVTVDAADTAWENSTITARYGVIYDNTPELDADKPVIGYIDFGENMSSNAGSFIIQWNASGIFKLSLT